MHRNAQTKLFTDSYEVHYSPNPNIEINGFWPRSVYEGLFNFVYYRVERAILENIKPQLKLGS